MGTVKAVVHYGCGLSTWMLIIPICGLLSSPHSSFMGVFIVVVVHCPHLCLLWTWFVIHPPFIPSICPPFVICPHLSSIPIHRLSPIVIHPPFVILHPSPMVACGGHDLWFVVPVVCCPPLCSSTSRPFVPHRGYLSISISNSPL